MIAPASRPQRVRPQHTEFGRQLDLYEHIRAERGADNGEGFDERWPEAGGPKTQESSRVSLRSFERKHKANCGPRGCRGRERDILAFLS